MRGGRDGHRARRVGELAGVGAFGTCIVDGLAALEHARADVVVDFSSPGATLALAPIAAAAEAPMSGTTGLGDDARDAFDRAASRVPVLWEPNMSLGVHVLTELVKRVVGARGLGRGDRGDAPPGQGGHAERHGPSPRRVHRPRSRPGCMRCAAVASSAITRCTSSGAASASRLTHRATSRDVFAHGALRAARWIVGRPPGRYALRDVLG